MSTKKKCKNNAAKNSVFRKVHRFTFRKVFGLLIISIPLTAASLVLFERFLSSEKVGLGIDEITPRDQSYFMSSSMKFTESGCL